MLAPLLLLTLACDVPTVTATITPKGTTTDSVTKQPLADLSWTVTCAAGTNMTCNAAVGIASTQFAVNKDSVTEKLVATDYPGLTGGGSTTMPGAEDCFGCNVTVSVSGSCGNGLGAAATSGTTAAIIPPAVRIYGNTFDVTLNPAGSRDFTSLDAVPVNTPFRLSGGALVARPHLSEVATLRIVGAGIDLTRSYGDDPTTDRLEHDVDDAYAADATAIVTATSTGTVRAWLEFMGTTSNEVKLTIVPKSGGSGGGGGTSGGTGGGSGSTGGGGGSGAHGCNAMPGLDQLAWALAATLTLRRARARR